MSYGQRVAKVDLNHHAVVTAFKKCGVKVLDTHVLGDGAPDIICTAKWGMFPVEIKRKGGKLTQDQVDFHAAFPRVIYIVTDPADVPAVILAASREGA